MIRLLPVFKGYTADSTRSLKIEMGCAKFLPLLNDKGARLFYESRRQKDKAKLIVLGRKSG